jgi:hypothetical protein
LGIWHFLAFMLVSFAAFLGILRLALKRRAEKPRVKTVLWVAGVVVVGGMVFAKAGASAGLPVWMYYGLPAVLTWSLPPIIFRMRGSEVARYLPLALVMAPAIHVLFSFFLGWNEYMPFIPVPSLHVR